MYAMFYMARYNLSVADPYLLKAFGWTKEDLGILKSAGLITYGVSVFLNGPLADRIGGKRAILIGAAGSLTANVVFAFLGWNLASGGGGRPAAIAGLGEYDTGDETTEDAARPATLGFVLRKVFATPVAWVIAGASFCTGIVRQGILDQWSILYFKEVYGLAPNAAIVQLLQAWLIPVLSVCAGLAAGIISDRVFGARRGPVICIAFGGQILAL